MKVAILSDIHANLEALQAVLAHLDSESCEGIFCLGDVVGYGPDPNECCALLRERGIQTLKGNHDEAAAAEESLAGLLMNPSAMEGILWTRKVLSPENRQWLSALPLVLDMPVLNATLCHANLHNPGGWGYILTHYEAHLTFQKLARRICFYGHSHQPVVITINATGEASASTPVSLQVPEGASYLVNCGSVGQPRDGDPRSCYVLFDTIKETVLFQRVPYPHEITRQKIIDLNLPPESAFRLAAGA